MVAALAAGLIGGWLIAGLFVSPAQQAALASPPPAGPILAEVERGDLADTISFDATVSRASSQVVQVRGPEGISVVTGQPMQQGSEVAPGAVVLEVNGRPLFAIPGAFPFYRDLTSGDEGPDVVQLQQGLNAAGISVSTDGRFGAGTASAIRKLYTRAGYKPPAADVEGPDGQTTQNLVVPTTELVSISALPAFLKAAPAVSTVVGDETTIEFEQGSLVGLGVIPDAAAARLEVGMVVDLQTDAEDVSGEVVSIGDPDPETGDSQVVVSVAEDALDLQQVGQSVLAVVVIELAATDSLIVPSHAVAPSGDDDPVVVKQQDDGSFVVVPVREIASLSGRSAVVPIEEGDLVEGDLVRVG